MSLQSAALLLFRRRAEGAEVLLVHPGGPFWAKRDESAWSLPKGEFAPGEEPLKAAQREFAEETGFALPPGPFIDLGSAPLKSGKVVHAWAAEGDCDPAQLRSNWIEIAWPPRSGRNMRIPEVDRAAFFSLPDACRKIHAGQLLLLERFAAVMAVDRTTG